MTSRKLNTGPIQRQRGAALFIGLVLLIVLSLIAVAASRNTVMQEKMTGNVLEANAAFQRAEDVLRQIELQIRIASETGAVPSVDIEDWGDSGYPVSDCTGANLIETENPMDWTDAPVKPSGAIMKYRVLNMTAEGTAVPCRPDESENNARPTRSSYNLIIAYARGPAGTSEVTAVSTYFFDIGS